MFKFGVPQGTNDEEYFYENVFSVEQYPTWSRLVIGARERQIPLMLDIARTWAGPYGILYYPEHYTLNISRPRRNGHPHG